MTPESRNAFSAYRFREDLLDWRGAPFVVGLRVLTGVAPCERAKTLAGAYRLDSAPAFPPPECACSLGSCCCTWEPIFLDDPEPAFWKTPLVLHESAGPPIHRPSVPLTLERLRAMAGMLATIVGREVGEDSIRLAACNAGLSMDGPVPRKVGLVDRLRRLLRQ